MPAQHLPRGVVAVEHGVELAGHEALQRGAVAGELGAPRFQRLQHAAGVLQHHLAGRALRAGGGGRGGGRLGEGQRRGGGEQGRGQGHGEGGTADAERHGVLPSSGAGEGAGAALSPPPLNMYLPTIWIRSTAGVVNTSSSPGLNTSMSPPGCRPT